MSKETKDQPIIDDKDLAKDIVDRSYNLAIDHAIELVKRYSYGMANDIDELLVEKLENLKN